MVALPDYLEPSVDSCASQWQRVLERRPVPRGARGPVFLPVETLTCAAASLIVEHRRFGGTTAHLAPVPVQHLAGLFRRPPTSILAKMANLDGSRTHGGKYDAVLGQTLLNDLESLGSIYRTVLTASRATGIDPGTLPDFLGIENGGELRLLGQDELDSSTIERELKSIIDQAQRDNQPLDTWETEKQVLTLTRVGQHRFAVSVMSNCDHRCVFCGMSLPGLQGQRMMRASHIKPWRDSNGKERLDPRNGLAACPTHDAAFDAGLLTVNGGFRIHVSSRLQASIENDPIGGTYFSRPPLANELILPEKSDKPARVYLNWHQEHIYVS